MLETIKSFPAPISCFLILSFFENPVAPHFTLEVKVVHFHTSGGPEVSANLLDGNVTNLEDAVFVLTKVSAWWDHRQVT